MRISFTHANPQAGNESFLLRFDTGPGTNPCVLVDAGHGVDLDRLLGTEDRLAAICLTHAHLDHYAELAAAHRTDVPVYTSPATAAMLADVFDVADRDYDVRSPDTLTDAITPIEDWTRITDAVDVHPVPAGHVPGAVGFLVRVNDGDERHHLLATGDFTRRSAAGYPGFDPGRFLDVDVLFLTAATNDRFEPELTDALGTCLEHAHGGGRTLLATSGLVGVQATTLLAALATEYDLRVPIRPVGQVAKLYETLDYDHPQVDPIPLFEHTSECLEPGVITVAGPEIPTERSSGRLYGVLQDDPGACVVQLVGSGNDPVTEGKCRVHGHELINHPTRDTLEDVHDTVDPTHTVITHCHEGAKHQFNDLGSVVWASGSTENYTLYADGDWLLPPWMDGDTIRRPATTTAAAFTDADLLSSVTVPDLDRHDELDPASEGVTQPEIADTLHRHADTESRTQTATATTNTTDPPETQTEPPDMSTDDPDSDDEPDRQQDGLVNTTGGPSPEQTLDPAIKAALADGRLSVEDVLKATDYESLAADATSQPSSESSDEDGTPADTPDTDSNADLESDDADEVAVESSRADESGEDPVPTDTEEEGAAGATAGSASTADDSTEGVASGEAIADGATEMVPEADAPEPGGMESTPEAETDVPSDPDDGEGDVESRSEPSVEQDTQTEDEASTGTPVELSPVVVALATHAVRERPDVAGEDTRVGVLVLRAVNAYLSGLLSGAATGGDDERFDVEVDTSATLEGTLTRVLDGDGTEDAGAELLAAGVAALGGGSRESTVHVPSLEAYGGQLDAAADNDEYAFESRRDVVEAAVVWYLDRED